MPMMVGIDMRMSNGSMGCVSIFSLLDVIDSLMFSPLAGAYDSFVAVYANHVAVFKLGCGKAHS